MKMEAIPDAGNFLRAFRTKGIAKAGNMPAAGKGVIENLKEGAEVMGGGLVAKSWAPAIARNVKRVGSKVVEAVEEGIEMGAMAALGRRLQPRGTRAAPQRRVTETVVTAVPRGRTRTVRTVTEPVPKPRRKYVRRA